MVNDLNEYKAKKEGRLTPKEVIKNLFEAIERGEVESIVFVTESPDGLIKIGWSNVKLTQAIGMLHCAQNELMADMYEG